MEHCKSKHQQDTIQHNAITQGVLKIKYQSGYNIELWHEKFENTPKKNGCAFLPMPRGDCL